MQSEPEVLFLKALISLRICSDVMVISLSGDIVRIKLQVCVYVDWRLSGKCGENLVSNVSSCIMKTFFYKITRTCHPP